MAFDWDKLTDRLGTIGENVGTTLRGIFGARNERMVKRLDPLVRRINQLESWAQGLSAEQFPAQTNAWKAAIARGEKTLDDVLPEAFALCREAAVRTLGMRHYDVQLVGGMVLHEGQIAEMMTGEGKTLVATLPLYLNALSGKTVYLVTVNDYLARRDAAWMGPIYDYLGVSVGSIQSDMSPWERQPVYLCDIVYGTNNEYGFDYLRDNMKTRAEDQVQKDLFYAIVDEVDSILIDEARTPLIISGPAADTSDKYKLADEIARKLVKDEHFEVKEKERSVALLEAGIEAAEKLVGVPSFFVPPHEDWLHFIENALRAHHLNRRDTEYVVEGDEVIIVDEFTGRKMTGRRWSDGLHQAVETKEGLKPKQENQTLATITLQNYFRMFRKLAGMTGTAITEAGEFHKIYKLDVVSIPTNMPIARADHEDVVYRTAPEKWKAIGNEIEETHKKGQPVLVGTTSIEKSEVVSKLLTQRGIPHEVLNAKNHEREATIVARAGERGAVTVATNMAGRGTDIKLGGNFEHRLEEALKAANLNLGDLDRLAEIDAIRKQVRAQCDADEQEVLSLGGLYVLGTERHEARRIDNQLRGRTGRQGNVGKSRFFLSLEDDLMRIFYRDWVKNAMEKLGMKEDVPIESGMVTRAIARAQRKVEDRNFEIRRNLLEYDEVMNGQRKEIYGTRQDVLFRIELPQKLRAMLERVVERNARQVHLQQAEGFRTWFQRSFGFEVDAALAAEATAKVGDHRPVTALVLEAYAKREAELGSEVLREVERYLLLKAIDDKWRDHLLAIDALKAGIGLRGYAQVDPKTEYKKEGYQLFEKLLQAIEDEVTSLILRIQVDPTAVARSRVAAPRYVSPLPPGQTPGNPALQAGAVPPLAPPRPEGAAAALGEGGLAPSTGTAPSGPAAPGAAPRSPAPPAARPLAPPPRRPVGPAFVPASQQFDLARRQQALAQARDTQPAAPRPSAGGASPAAAAQPAARVLTPKDLEGVGRNDACPCGSGQKFKKCHGREA
ncbi:MAG: preprotein translocase subunit SecA [Planctomycetes bacterium]|nr:preprotein translocase subunit SecA [Planctomycetota bacterium]